MLLVLLISIWSVNAWEIGLAGVTGSEGYGSSSALFNTLGDGGKRWGLSLINFNVPLGPYPTYSTLRFSDWNRYIYENEKLDEEEKLELLGKIPKSGYDLFLNSEFELFRIILAPYFVSLGLRGGVRGHLPKDLIDLVLRGNDFEREYSIGGLNTEGILGTELSIGRAFKFNLGDWVTFSFVSLKGFWGLSHFHLKTTDGSLTTDYEGVSSYLRAVRRESYGGIGILTDLGFKFYPSNRFSIGLFVEDVGPGIYWYRDSKEEIVSTSLEKVQLVDFLGSNSDQFISEKDKAKEGPYWTHPPSSLILGVTYRWTRYGTLFASSGYTPYETPQREKGAWAGIGLEQRILFLKTRAGIRLGGVGKYAVGFGFSLPIWKVVIDMGFENIGGLLWSSRGGRMGFGLSTRER